MSANQDALTGRDAVWFATYKNLPPVLCIGKTAKEAFDDACSRFGVSDADPSFSNTDMNLVRAMQLQESKEQLLLEVMRKLLNDNFHLLNQVTETQVRCAELVEERRKMVADRQALEEQNSALLATLGELHAASTRQGHSNGAPSSLGLGDPEARSHTTLVSSGGSSADPG